MLCFFQVNSQSIAVTEFASGIDLPVAIENAGDDRLFVVGKNGIIYIVDPSGAVNSTAFLNIDPLVNSNAGERGLLGLAFHPDYATNGLFFVHYNNSSGNTVIASYTVSTTNPNQADASSAQILLTIDQPYNNHNGGDLKFGPDGYLYIGMGDGGSAGDPQNFAQNRQSLLGKMLRINVDTGSNYTIPSDNPFVDTDETLDEIWSLGLRNPWRFSFDRLTGEMYMADVGQNVWEEINVEAPNTAGLNYGWKCYEGPDAYSLSGCGDPSIYTDPVYAYLNSEVTNGCSVTGGYVYRGSESPSLYGTYIYADYCSGKIWGLKKQSCGTWLNEQIFNGPSNEYTTFGEDAAGEIYVAAIGDGKIFKISSTCNTSYNATVSNACSAVEVFGSISLNISGDVEADNIMWSNGATGPVLEGLSEGTYSVEIVDNAGCTFLDCFDVISEIEVPICPEVNPVTICGSNNTQLQGCIAPDGYGYLWYKDGVPIDPPITTQEITVDEAGLYSLQFTSSECNSAIFPLTTVEVILLGSIGLMSDGVSVVVDDNSFATYLWFFNGTLQPDEDGTSIQLNGFEGEVSVIGIDENGCQTDLSVLIVSSLKDISFVENFEVSPNPFTSEIFLNLMLNEQKDFTIEIYSMDSKLIQSVKYNNTKTFTELLNLSRVTSGSYFIRINFGEYQLVEKIVKL